MLEECSTTELLPSPSALTFDRQGLQWDPALTDWLDLLALELLDPPVFVHLLRTSTHLLILTQQALY